MPALFFKLVILFILSFKSHQPGDRSLSHCQSRPCRSRVNSPRSRELQVTASSAANKADATDAYGSGQPSLVHHHQYIYTITQLGKECSDVIQQGYATYNWDVTNPPRLATEALPPVLLPRHWIPPRKQEQLATNSFAPGHRTSF